MFFFFPEKVQITVPPMSENMYDMTYHNKKQPRVEASGLESYLKDSRVRKKQLHHFFMNCIYLTPRKTTWRNKTNKIQACIFSTA